MAMPTLCVSFGQKVFGLSNQRNILTGQLLNYTLVQNMKNPMTDEGKKSTAMKYFKIVHVNTLSNSKRL